METGMTFSLQKSSFNYPKMFSFGEPVPIGSNSKKKAG